VRLVRRLNPATVPAGQSEMFAVYRYHAVFTDNPGPMADAEATHRDHAIIEQVIADLRDSALAHLPSGMFAANAVWLTCAAIAHNLSRSAGALASAVHARARTGTIRAQLIHGPRSDHSLRTPPCAAPATGLALGTRPRRAVPPSPPRLPPHPSLTTAPPRADRRPPVEERADRRTAHAQNHKDQLQRPPKRRGGSRLSPRPPGRPP
jgi:hypothetical protein